MKTEDGTEYTAGKKYYYVWNGEGHKMNFMKYKNYPYEGWHTEYFKNMQPNVKVFGSYVAARNYAESQNIATPLIDIFTGNNDKKKILHKIIDNLTDEQAEDVVNVFKELERAETKFPDWPADIIHRHAILNEECGELGRACLQYRYENGTTKEIETEAIQTAAMSLRFLFQFIESKTV